MSIDIKLSTKNFAEASKIVGNNQFHFIIGDKEVLCHKFAASFLSQSITKILLSDPIIDTFIIDLGSNSNAEQKEQIESKIQTNLQKLIFGENIEITREELHNFISQLDNVSKNTKISELLPTNISALLLLNQSLKNDEISEQIYKCLFSSLIENNLSPGKEAKTLTKEEIEHKLVLIQKVELFLSIIENSQGKENRNDFIDYAIHYLEQEYSEIVDEIASHFFEISEKYINEMNEKLLGAVLSSESLQIENEDSLLSTLLKRRKYLLSKDEENNENGYHEFFIEKVEFEYLTEKSIQCFLDEIEFDDISYDIWSQIKKRLILPVKITLPKNSRIKKPTAPTFEYDSLNPFNGIFHHLTEVSNGNIQTNQTIEIKASNLCCGSYETLVDFQNTEGYTHVSGNHSPRWLQIDFKTRKVQIDSYLIKSPKSQDSSGACKLKSWKVEVSNDGLKWDMIDERENVSELNGDHKLVFFKIKTITEPVRFFRIISNQDNWNNSGGFNISKLELFGNITESM